VRARVAAATLLAATVAGCGPGAAAISPGPGGAAAASASAVPLQAANGPVAAPPAQAPLTLRFRRGRDPVRLRFGAQPRSGLLFDLDTGEVLWRHLPQRVLPIASLTKIMTALIVVEKTSPGAHARIGKNATQFRGSGVGVLPRGKSVPVEGLLYGLLLPSGNDAGVALAERIAGSDGRFARLMTRRAQELGLTCTRYVSSYGLQPGNRSCAADLAALTRLAIGQPRIARIVRRARASVPFPIKGKRLEVSTTNPLLKARYPGTIGLKTGFTNRAGHCLIAVVRRGGHTVAAVLLHSPNTAAQGKRMIEAGLRALAREDAG
jgi:serine-type D-Ala-D-Ala carboxypeptidase (penicillin-binding protein 5/6)